MAEDYYKERVQAVSDLSNTIGNVLQQRFNAQQAEDFTRNELARFQEATANFQQMVGTFEDPNQMGQAFLDWHHNTMMPFLTQATTKYSNNPQIQNIAQGIYKGSMDGLNQFMGFQKGASEIQENQAQARAADANARQSEAAVSRSEALLPHEIAGKQADVQETGARIGLLKAQTNRANAEAVAAGQKGMADRFIIPPNASPAEARVFARQMQPKLAKEYDTQTVTQLALREVQRRRGMPRPDGLVWGEQQSGAEGVLSDAQVAEDILRQSPQFDKLLEAGRLSQVMGPEFLNQFQGYYDDVAPALQGSGSPPLPEELAGRLQGTQDTGTVLSVLMATPKRALSGLNTENVDSFVNESLSEMQDPREMGPIFQSMFETGARVDEFNKVRDPNGNEIKSYDDLLKSLREQYQYRVMGNLVASDVKSRPTREAMAKIGAAAIQRFAPLVAQRVGIELPKRQPKQKGLVAEASDTFARILRSVGISGDDEEEVSLTSTRKPKKSLIEADSDMVSLTGK